MFAFSVLVSVGLHANLPPLRRLTRDAVNHVLATTLEGRLIIEDIERIGFGEVDIRSVVALDPQGRQTIRATGLRGRLDLWGFGREALHGNTVISLPLVQIDDAEVLLERGADGRLGIERTFLPKPRKKPTAIKPKTTKPTKKFAFALEKIEINHAWIHGNVTAPRVLDADVTRLRASARISPDKLAVDVEPTGIRERGLLPEEISGSGDYHLHVDIPQTIPGATETPPPAPRMWSGFTGHAGQVEVIARASLEGKTVAASLELPLVDPAAARRLVPGLPLRERASLRAGIEGTFPLFEIDGRLAVSPREGKPASLTVAGKLDVQGGPKLVVDVTGKDLNARALRENLPETDIDARARLTFAATPQPRFVVDAMVDPHIVAGQTIPAIEAHAVFDHGLLEGRVTVHEPGAPTRGTFVVEGRDLVRFEAETTVASFETMPRLKGPLSGSARVRIRGAVRGSELDARVDGSVHGLQSKPAVSLEDGRINGHLRGPFDRLEVDALVSGEHLRAGENEAARVTVRARGPIATPSVEAHLEGGDVEDLRASARIDPRAKAVRNVELHLQRGGEELRGKAAELRAEKGSVAARGLSLEGPGLGSLGGSLVVANQEVTGKLEGKGIDLARLGRLFGIGKRAKGIADVDVSLTQTRRGRKGHVRLQVANATVSPMPGIEFPGTAASINATFEDDHAQLEASLRIQDQARPGEDPATACDGTIAEVRVADTEGTLQGPLLAPSTWAKLTGKARVAAQDTRLDCLAKRLPIALILTEVGGRLDASVAVERPAGQRFVTVKELDVHTRGLKIAGPQMFGEDKPRWESRSMDVAVSGSLDGASGATTAKVALMDTSLIAELGTTINLDLRTLVDDPRKRLESITQSAGTLTFTVPRRSVASLKSLPSVLHDKLPPFEGEFALTVTGNGTLAKPVVRAHASAYRWSHVDERGLPTPWSLPVDLDVLANYDAKKAGVVAQVRRDGREIASIVGNTEVDLPALMTEGELPTRFDLRTSFSRAPIGKLPYLAERGIEANVSGTVLVTQRGEQRTAKARLFLPGLRVGNEVTLERAAVSLDIDPRIDKDDPSTHGAIQIELGGRDGGRIDAGAYAGVRWEGLVPQVDDSRAAGLSIRANEFRLSSLQPIVTGVFSRLDGRLNGYLHVASTMYGDESQGHVEANMELDDGVFHLPRIGQELRNAHVSLRSRERGSLHLEDIRAEGISGRIRGSAMAKMKGLSFQSATGDFTIDKSEALPITFEGVPLGQAFGNISVVADKRDREMHVTVRVPKLHLDLPASSSRAVQPLDPNPEIIVSHPIGPAKEKRQEGAMAWLTTLELGTVDIEGTGVDIRITSPKATPPRIELRDEARLSGDIEVTRGTFDVIGKRFEIERGLVRLREEEAGNPYVNVTARWDAPNGSRIYVDYVGVLKPITEQKLRFRSDPPMPQQAILSMILTGDTPESAKEASTQGAASAAELAANVVGGEIASTQINAVLSQIAPLRGLSTRLGTSDSGRLRTTVMYELGDTVKAQASYEGSPSGRLEGVRTAPNESALTTNRTEVSVDWRFYRNWALRGSFGFGGINQQPSSGLDLLWQYRY